MIKITFFPVILFSFFSCSGGKEQEVLNIHDLIPQAKNSQRGASEETVESVYVSPFDIELARRCGLHVLKIMESAEPMFLDRFVPKKKMKLTLESEDNDLFLGQWIFDDSIKTMNALLNWIDCFGSDCQSFKFGQPAIMQQGALLVFVNDTSLTSIFSGTNAPNGLKPWQKYLEKKYGIDQWNIVIWQKPFKNSMWMRYDAVSGGAKKEFLPLGY